MRRGPVRGAKPAPWMTAGLAVVLVGCSDAPAPGGQPEPPRIGSFIGAPALPVPTASGPDLAPRVAALEATVARLEARLAQTLAQTPPSPGNPPRSGGAAVPGSPQPPEPPSHADAEARSASLESAFRAEAAPPGPSLASQSFILLIRPQ